MAMLTRTLTIEILYYILAILARHLGIATIIKAHCTMTGCAATFKYLQDGQHYAITIEPVEINEDEEDETGNI